MGSYLAVNRRDFDWRLSVPFFVASVPMAFVGGLIPLDATVYFLLLGFSLAIAGVSLIVRTAPDGATTLARAAGGWPVL